MKKIIVIFVAIIVIAIILSSVGSCNVCSNPQHHNYFAKNGRVIPDTMLTSADTFKLQQPASIEFFLESSGSMNGLLRGGIPTDFKRDLWEIISYYSYSTIVPRINILSSDGGKASALSMNVHDFQNPLNGGGFISGKSTNLCEMLRVITKSIHPLKNEVAVFISDMEYDPVGAVAPAVLRTVYPTDVAGIFAEASRYNHDNFAVSLIAATSNSVDKSGQTTTNKRPYYYVIVGKPECVGFVRNQISILLNEQHHFVDNIESGFHYGNVPYTIGDYSGCVQLFNEPSLSSISDAGCTFDINIKLENYRWILSTNPEVFKKAFHISSMSGSVIKVDSITYEVKDVVGTELKRDVTAKVHMSVNGMAQDCDLLKWNIDVPFTDVTNLAGLFTDNPNAIEQTYSIREFITGMFRESIVSFNGKDNYIHISKI